MDAGRFWKVARHGRPFNPPSRSRCPGGPARRRRVGVAARPNNINAACSLINAWSPVRFQYFREGAQVEVVRVSHHHLPRTPLAADLQTPNHLSGSRRGRREQARCCIVAAVCELADVVLQRGGAARRSAANALARGERRTKSAIFAARDAALGRRRAAMAATIGASSGSPPESASVNGTMLRQLLRSWHS